MRFELAALGDHAAWERADVKLPQFDVEAMRERTWRDPRWVHFGSGNIFKGYIAALQQDLLDQGVEDYGIIAAESFSRETVEEVLKPYDLLTLQVVMKADGKLDKRVIASISEAIFTRDPAGWKRMRTIFVYPGFSMVSFTITEKGYALEDARGELLPYVTKDFELDPATEIPTGTMAQIAALLFHRFQEGAHPLTLVSFDNFSHNGEKLRSSVLAMAQAWLERGRVGQDFLDYLNDPARVSTPITVIDRITPRPSPEVAKQLVASGLDDFKLMKTEIGGYFAPFVNLEEAQYLVIDDCFVNGRPKLEEAGAYFTDAETTDRFERMKVTTCLNPLHTAMSPYGVLLDIPSIALCMKDPAIVKLIRRIGYDEGMPVVTDPGIIEPKDFLREVLEDRFSNPYIPDEPFRILTDNSQKVGIRFGETIKSYRDREALDPKNLTGIALGIAGWMRYLLEVDDQGQTYECSADPMLKELQAQLVGIEVGKPESFQDQLKPILSSSAIFRSNLYDVGLGETIEGFFCRMLEGPGAVRRLLDEETAKF